MFDLIYLEYDVPDLASAELLPGNMVCFPSLISVISMAEHCHDLSFRGPQTSASLTLDTVSLCLDLEIGRSV
jgi:hypothetical protein